MLIEYKLRDEHNPNDQVVSVTTPRVCKEMLLADKYDLLITGGRIQGRGEAGVELTRFAKEHCPETKIVLMSSWTDPEAALTAGANRYWLSSSRISELIEIIKDLFP